jgi:hypothetical protein
MSGLKEPHLAHFLRLIRFRLGSAGVLAQLAGVGRCHLSSMLHGDTSRGVFTWSKVRRHVTAVEWSFLEKCSAWNSFSQVHPELSDAALRIPTCDNPRDPIMPVLCSGCGAALKLLRCDPDRGGKVSHGMCPACVTRRMTPFATAAEIAEVIERAAVADAADPRVIPLARQCVEPADLALSS